MWVGRTRLHDVGELVEAAEPPVGDRAARRDGLIDHTRDDIARLTR